MFDLFLFDEQILMPGIISKFLIHLEIRIKLITDREMLLFLFSPFLRSKLQVTVQKTQYIQCISQFDCLKPFVLYSWLANYFQFEKIKGNLFTFHRTCIYFNTWKFLFDFKNPTIMMSSVYKYSNSQEHLWIMNFVWYKTVRDCLYKFYMTMCTYINLIGNDRYMHF